MICMLLGHVDVIEGDSYNRSWIRNINMECSHLRWCIIVQCMKTSMEVGSSLSFNIDLHLYPWVYVQGPPPLNVWAEKPSYMKASN